jgi:drug/metabolite transporter (DMT)-like permease
MMKTNNTAHSGNWGVLFAFLSASLFAALNVALRLSEPYLTVWHVMFGRSLFGVAAMLAIARWMRIDLLGRHRPTLVLAGLTGVGGVTCLMAAIYMLPLFEALVLLYLYPVFAAMLSPYVAGDRIRGMGWLLIGLAFIGTVLILWSGQAAGRLQWGHLAGLTAGFGYGLTITLIRRVSAFNSPLTPFFYISLVGTVVCIGPLLFQQSPILIQSQGAIGLLVISTLAACAYLASNKALSYLPSPKTGVIGMSEVVFGAILGLVLFNEPMGWRSVLGGFLIISSDIWLTVRSTAILRQLDSEAQATEIRETLKID